MENPENTTNETPPGKRPGGNNLHTPPKPPSDDLIAALSDLSIIIFITVVGNYVRIYYNGKKDILVKGTLKTVWLMCDPECYMKTHKSYIANLNFGTRFWTHGEGYEMEMTNLKTVKVGDDYKDEFNEKRK